jgi:hypothetical protein
MLPGVSSQGSVPVGRLRARLLDAPLRWLAAAVGVVALGVSGLFGGFQKASTPLTQLPSATPSVANVGAPWNITVQSVIVLDQLEPLRLKNPGDRWLVVVAVIEVTANESFNVNRAIRIRGAEGVAAEPDQIRLVRDTSAVTYLQPGLPERVGFFWEQAAAAPVPTRVDVGIFGQTYAYDSTNHLPGWVPDSSPRAHVLMAPQDRRGSASPGRTK